MRILIYMTAHGRQKVTSICYQSVNRFIADAISANKDLFFQVLVCCTTDEDAAQAASFGFWVFQTENFPLGRKHNKGLEFAINHLEFDYILQMNSDNVLSIDFMEKSLPYLKQGIPFLRIKDLFFVNFYTGETVFHSYEQGCGIRYIRCAELKQGATFFKGKASRDFAHVLGFFGSKGKELSIPAHIYKRDLMPVITGVSFELWDNEKNKGLDTNSFVRLYKCFPEIYNTPILPGVFVVDIKTEENIHPFSEFENNSEKFLYKNSAEFRKSFPEIQF